MFDRKWGKKDPPTKIRAAIRKAVVEHRAELLREWEQKVCRTTVQWNRRNFTPELTLLAYDHRATKAVTEMRRFRIIRRPNRQVGGRGKNIFVLVPATELPEVSPEVVSAANRRHQLRALLVRDDVQPSSIPQMFERAGLRMMRNTVVYSDFSVPRRVLNAWTQNSQDQLIAKAGVSEDRLFLLSCGLDPYEVAFDNMPSLKRIPVSSARTSSWMRMVVIFTGRVQMSILILTPFEPRSIQKHGPGPKYLRHSNSRHGAAIAKLRLASGLKQSEIEGLSERQVRRIERGEGTTYEALSRLASAHHMDVNEYLRKIAANVSDASSLKERSRRLSPLSPKPPRSARRSLST